MYQYFQREFHSSLNVLILRLSRLDRILHWMAYSCRVIYTENNCVHTSTLEHADKGGSMNVEAAYFFH